MDLRSAPWQRRRRLTRRTRDLVFEGPRMSPFGTSQHTWMKPGHPPCSRLQVPGSVHLAPFRCRCDAQQCQLALPAVLVQVVVDMGLGA